MLNMLTYLSASLHMCFCLKWLTYLYMQSMTKYPCLPVALTALSRQKSIAVA